MKRNKLKLSYVACIALSAVFLHACYYDNAEDLYPPVDCAETVPFATDVESIIATNCAIPGCHASGTPRVPLTNHAEIQAAVNDHNLGTRVENGSMPPSGPLPSADIEAIRCWIAQGAQNN